MTIEIIKKGDPETGIINLKVIPDKELYNLICEACKNLPKKEWLSSYKIGKLNIKSFSNVFGFQGALWSMLFSKKTIEHGEFEIKTKDYQVIKRIIRAISAYQKSNINKTVKERVDRYYSFK